jgi:hypothetical protein
MALNPHCIIIITFTRERPEGFRQASPTPREGDCRSRRGPSIALNPAVFPHKRSYLPFKLDVKRNPPSQCQHCDCLTRRGKPWAVPDYSCPFPDLDRNSVVLYRQYIGSALRASRNTRELAPVQRRHLQRRGSDHRSFCTDPDCRVWTHIC